MKSFKRLAAFALILGTIFILSAPKTVYSQGIEIIFSTGTFGSSGQYDNNGYDHNGYDRYGYDRYGYDRDGRDRNGCYRERHDRDDYDRHEYKRDNDDRDRDGDRGNSENSHGRGHKYGHYKDR